MKIQPLPLLLLSLFLLVLSGCKTQEGTVTFETPPSPPPAPSELEGSWVTACLGPDAQGDYSKETFVFTGPNLQVLKVGYGNDSLCTFQTHTHDMQVTTTVGNPITDANGQAVKELDATVISSDLTFHLATLTDSINATGGWCQKIDWVIESPVSVLGCIEMGGMLQGDLLKTIYQLQGNVLFLGSDVSQDTTGRDNSLNPNGYTKL